MDRDGAIGFLLVGNLNLLPWDEKRDDEDFPGCCPIHCGPCAALKWLSEHDRDQVDEWVRACNYQEGGWVFWNEKRNGVNWELVQSIWDRRKGCSSVNGVYEPCKEEEEEE